MEEKVNVPKMLELGYYGYSLNKKLKVDLLTSMKDSDKNEIYSFTDGSVYLIKGMFVKELNPPDKDTNE